MEWNRNVPKTPGFYLRVNAGHTVTLHRVWKDGRFLKILWGWGGESGILTSRKRTWKGKLTGWQWYGPIPLPEIDRRPTWKNLDAKK